MNDFKYIYELYNKDIYRLIYSYTLNYDDAIDILQDTFIELHKNINKIPCDNIQIKKWLITVASNKSKNFMKSFWKKKIVFDDKKILEKRASIFNNSEIFDLLKKINKKYRITIYLYYYEGFKIEEISKILKISTSAVKMRLSRAKDMLRREMEGKYERF